MNIQAICDSNLKFLNVVTGTPGRTHDSRLLRQSKIFYDFEDTRKFMKNMITVGHEVIRPYLLGSFTIFISIVYFIV